MLHHHPAGLLAGSAVPTPPPTSPSRHHLLLPPTRCSTSDSTTSTSSSSAAALDAALLPLLNAGDAEGALALLLSSPPSPSPSTHVLSLLLSLLSRAAHRRPLSVSAALSLLRRHPLRLFSATSLSLLASAAARSHPDPLFALSFILSLLRHNLPPHPRAYTSALARLTSSGRPSDALRLFSAVLDHLPLLRPDTPAFNAALNACTALADARQFRLIFDEMPRRGADPDAWTFNIAIKMCARVGRADLLPRALAALLARGLAPCRTTFHSLVAAFVGFGDLAAAEAVVQAMRSGRRDICTLLNQIIATNGDQDIDHNDDNAVLEEILPEFIDNSDSPSLLLQQNYPPDSRTYTTLMKGYMNDRRVEDVLQTVRAMLRESEADPASRPDSVTYTTVVSALVAVGDMARAHAVLAEMAMAGVPANAVTYNVLLKGYCRRLQLDNARTLVRDMESAGVEPDAVTYNTLIDGCVLVDDNAGALACFNEMRSRGIPPTRVSYTTLMKAFASMGQPKLAHKVFAEMENDPRARPDLVAWNMLVDSYSRVGHLDNAKEVVDRMKESGVSPDVATYGSLASGIAVARKPGEALLLWKEVKERMSGESPVLVPDEGLLETVADVFVRAAFFQKALEVVACMEEHGIAPKKTKYKTMYVEMHSRMFTSKHASQARQDRRRERKRAAEAFKFWLGLPNSYYRSDWRPEEEEEDDENEIS